MLAAAATGLLLLAPSARQGAAARVSPEVNTVMRLMDIGATASGSYLAGRYALLQRDYEAAAELLQRTLELDPSAPGLERDALVMFISTGNWRRAEALANGANTARRASIS